MTIITIILSLFMPFISSCDQTPPESVPDQKEQVKEMQISNLDTATLAGGCFWCVEASFDQINGVVEAVSGYAGGDEPNPTYKEVSRGETDHAEAVQVYYDPDVLDYKTIMKIFFTAHDPTQLNRQGPDIGPQYRSAIFYHDEEQYQIAQNMIDSLNKTGTYSKEIVTKVNPLDKFYMAEEYHQDYEEKHPNDRYIQTVSKPKINKVRKEFSHLLKDEE